jgi:hypothetical protein
VTGRIITGSQIDDCFIFLNLTQPIWAKSMVTPRMPSPSEGASSNKLIGHCVWPLSIPLPRMVTVPSGSGDERSFRLPETFLERNTRVSVQYDLTINVLRGMLRTDNRFVRHHLCILCHLFSMRICAYILPGSRLHLGTFQVVGQKRPPYLGNLLINNSYRFLGQSRIQMAGKLYGLSLFEARCSGHSE